MLSEGADSQRLAAALRQLEQLTATYVKLEDETAALRAKVAELERDRDGEAERRLEWRGIVAGDQCNRCDGAGVRSYSSTATWRGGIGGQAFTTDVCDKCWGSGRADSEWPRHDAARAAQREG